MKFYIYTDGPHTHVAYECNALSLIQDARAMFFQARWPATSGIGNKYSLSSQVTKDRVSRTHQWHCAIHSGVPPTPLKADGYHKPIPPLRLQP